MADYYNNLEPNLLEINYRLFAKYSQLFVCGEITEEFFNKKKRELLDDCAWREEYRLKRGREAKEYALGAYYYLLNTYYDIGTLSESEFNHYSKILMKLL